MNSLQNPLLCPPARPLPLRIGIIGAGTIGPDIGYYFKSQIAGLELVLIDIVPEALQRAEARILGYVEKGLQRGKLTEAQASDVRRGIVTSTDYGRLAGCDWVIEAATESLPLKRQIFAQVEAHVGADALITSNTSSIPASRLFAELRQPKRATVTHFFAPAFQNPIVEVIDWPQLDPALREYMRWVFAVTGKVPLLTRDVVCFMLDRIFDNWCNEAGLLLASASAAEIDTVAQEFVHAGPFYVLNLANGNPIIIETNSLQAEEEGAHYRPAEVFASAARWPTVAPGSKLEVPAERRAQIRDRLLGILFSQSVDILDRNIGTAADLELGARLAFGFKHGPLELMRQTGEAQTERIFARLAVERPGMPQPRRPLRDYRPQRQHVLLDTVGAVKVITLRRPEAMNALHDELNDEILAVLRESERDPAVSGFVITGYGPRAFCAGADIGRFPSLLGDAAAAAEYARACSRVLVHLDAMSKPVVAALNGMALGGGLELAIRCHGLVAVADATLQFPEVTLGIAAGIGGLVVPYRRWPHAAGLFHTMLLDGQRVTAAEAHAEGVLDVVVHQPRELIGAALILVEQLARRMPRIASQPVALAVAPQASTTGGKSAKLSAQVRGIIAAAVGDGAAADSLDAALEVGYQAFGRTACTAAAREGIAAFAEKRAADFQRTG
jgi:enoyl-CoA hydratase/3-hydroxyacyl-CoA dehydrogenase